MPHMEGCWSSSVYQLGDGKVSLGSDIPHAFSSLPLMTLRYLTRNLDFVPARASFA